jgi:hypothetical protein
LSHCHREQEIGQIKAIGLRILLDEAAELQHLNHPKQFAVRAPQSLDYRPQRQRPRLFREQFKNVEAFFERRSPVAPIGFRIGNVYDRQVAFCYPPRHSVPHPSMTILHRH